MTEGMKWPEKIPDDGKMDSFARELLNNITQGTGPTEDLDFKGARIRNRKFIKAILKSKFVEL
jgi:hypothetical protein